MEYFLVLRIPIQELIILFKTPIVICYLEIPSPARLNPEEVTHPLR